MRQLPDRLHGQRLVRPVLRLPVERPVWDAGIPTHSCDEPGGAEAGEASIKIEELRDKTGVADVPAIPERKAKK
jgi:hypothetical protein